MPWILAALLLSASTVAVTVVSPPRADPLPATSREEVARLLEEQAPGLVADIDLDGLPDTLENYAYGSDPARWNTSRTPLPDGWLADWGYEPTDESVASKRMAAPPPDILPASYRGLWPDAFTPTLLDVYRFGRPGNWSEADQGPFENGIDPRQWDANGDGLPDAWLLAHGVDPRLSGLRDQRLAGPAGLTVKEAFEAGTDPTLLDSDRDGLPDAAELAGQATWGGRTVTFHRTDPSKSSTSGTGVCDGYLVGYGLNPTDPRAALSDRDHDGATTQAEFNWSLAAKGPAACAGPVGLDPTRLASGPSGLPDGWLLRYGLDPLSASADRVTDEASEAGGLTLKAMGLRVTLTLRDEYRVNRPPAWNETRDGPWWGGSDPTRSDSDGDGLPDIDEVRGWSVNATRIPGGPPGQPVHVQSNPARADGDGDGLGDGDERASATHPSQRDTDFDGLDDGLEIALDLELAGEDPADNRSRLDPTRADSAGDLLGDGQRMALLANASARAANGDDYPFPGGAPRTYDDVAHQHAGGAALPSPAPGPLLAELLGLSGDLDGDGLANLLDQDIDGDEVANGPEMRPELYEAAGFQPTPIARRATDALNRDSDGDGLLDGWEVINAMPNPAAGANDPDPALHDTDGDGVPDGDENSDDYVMHTVEFGQGNPQPRDYVHDNTNEQLFHTKPHVPYTDGDGLYDGWKVYWGFIHSGSTNGAPKPVPGLAQPNVPLAPQLVISRFTVAPAERTAFESIVGEPVTAHLPGGVTRAVQRIDAHVPWTFHSAQENKTNPFLQDTDLDQLLDPWEIYRSTLQPRPASDMAGGHCVAAGTLLDPLAPDSLDMDGDKVSTLDEQVLGTDPLCGDTDLGGLDDGLERDAGLDPTDPEDDLGGSDPTRDNDHDGLSDLCEVLGDHDCDGSIDGSSTDPSNPDSDGDGLLDGASLELLASDPRVRQFIDLGIAYRKLASGAYTLRGERGYSDPNEPSTHLDGVPDGWILAHGGTPRADWRTCYEHGLPLWWVVAAHGPWWGGALPSTSQDCAQLTQGADVDQDGLRDASGEDPIPVANHNNHYRRGSPFEQGLSPQAGRMRAQAAVDPSTETDFRVLRVPWSGSPVTLQPTTLTLTSVPSTLVRGETAQVRGRLVDASGAGVSGATIVVTLSGAESEPFGANFTRPDGTFEATVALQPAHAVAIPNDGLGHVLRSQTGGTVTWQTSLSGLNPGPRTLTVASYALNQTATTPARAAAQSAGQSVTVMHRDQLVIDAPERTRLGDGVTVTVRETDVAGLPRTDPIRVSWEGETFTLQVGTDGALVVNLKAPAGSGLAHLEIVTVPPAGSGVLPGQASASLQVQEVASLRIEPMARTDAGNTAVLAGVAATANRFLAGEEVDVFLSLPDGQPLLRVAAPVDGRGRFEAELPLAFEAPPGSYLLVVRLAAQETHTDAATSGFLPVRGFVQVQEDSKPRIASSGDRTVTAALLDAAGRGVAGRTLRLDLGEDHVTAATDSGGVARFPLSHVLGSGPHLETITFEGDASYAPSTLTRERTVQAPTRLAMHVTDGRPGGVLLANLALTDESGNALRSRAVSVTLADGTAIAGLTDPSGRALLQVPIRSNTQPGPVAVRGAFAGDGPGSYAASENRTVARLFFGTSFALPDSTVLLGDPVPPARLLNERGLPLRKAIIEISSADLTRTGVTADDGTFALVPAEQLPDQPGDVALQVRFAGDAAHEAAQASTVLRFRQPATLRLDLPHLVAGEPTVLRVAALSDGQAVLQGVVRVAFGNATGEAPIARDGVARVPLSLPPGASPGVLAVSFLDSLYAADDLRLEVPVVARTTLEAFAERGGPDGQELRLQVQARAGGQPLGGANLRVQVAGVSIAVTADAEGRANVAFPLPNEAAAVQVLFAGADGASPATFASILRPGHLALDSEPHPGRLVLGAAGVAVLLAAALAVFLQRRRHPVLHALLSAQRVLEARGVQEADVLAAYATLQDGLIEAGILRGPAATPRILASTLAGAVPLGRGEEPLHRLIGVFESARYSARLASREHAQAARAALRDLRRALVRSGIAWRPEVAA
ncbi:MAG: DUF4129 domain-containing protein [Candidatus Thermoplasmatota archaeon]|jgi:hypothetical protein